MDTEKMVFATAEEVDEMRRKYPKGTRVRLIHMDDDQAPPFGTEGTVRGVDDSGSLMVSWDNGSGLNALWGVDIVQKL